MSESEYGQRSQMENAAMIGTLHAQAAMIWPLEQPVLEKIGLFDAASVADLGCGTGQFAGRLARACPDMRVVGVDLFEGHIDRAKREWDLPNLEFFVGDARECPWHAETFDAVVIRHFLHALPEPEPVLLEARRILKPGGLLYMLAEDYQTLIFDADDASASSLFNEARPRVLAKGTDLHHGRTAHRALVEAGYDAVTVDGILVDTFNTSRDTFADMLRYWRDGYSDFLAEALEVEPASVAARFDAQIQTVLDPERYACWLLFALSAKRPR